MEELKIVPRRVRRKLAARSFVEAQAARLDAPDRPLQAAVRPLLVELAYLRQREQLPPADVLFSHARAQLNKVRVKLDVLGLDQRDIEDVYYALVAFVDESMQADQGPLKDFW